MPQLDATTFLSQVFWLSFFFFIFYLIVLKNILPTISLMIKARSKKVICVRENISLLNTEQVKIASDYGNIITKSFQESSELLNRINLAANEWVKDTTTTTNTQKTTSNFNASYIHTVGTVMGQKALMLNSVSKK